MRILNPVNLILGIPLGPLVLSAAACARIQLLTGFGVLGLRGPESSMLQDSGQHLCGAAIHLVHLFDLHLAISTSSAALAFPTRIYSVFVLDLDRDFELSCIFFDNAAEWVNSPTQIWIGWIHWVWLCRSRV